MYRKKPLYISLLLALIFFACVDGAAARSKSIKSKESRKTIQRASKLILETERTLERYVKQRNTQAVQVLRSRVQAELDRFLPIHAERLSQAKNEYLALQSEYQVTLASFLAKQNRLFDVTISQQLSQATASVAGATLASVEYLQLNYGRASIRSSTPTHLNTMASLFGSINAVIRGYFESFGYTLNALKELSDKLRTLEDEPGARPDYNQLAEIFAIQSQIDFITYDARIEASKFESFQRLLISLRSHANQISTDPALQALLSSSEEARYPNGALLSIRRAVASNGTSWLLFAPDIYESVNLTGSYIYQFNSVLLEALTRELQRIVSQDNLDAISHARWSVDLARSLFPILQRKLQESIALREQLAQHVTTAASQMVSAPSTGSVRLQRLVNEITQFRNLKRSESETLRSSIGSLVAEIPQAQAYTEQTIIRIGEFRDKFYNLVEFLPINTSSVEDFEFFISDPELFDEVIRPRYWEEVARTKNKSSSLKLKDLRQCLAILSEGDGSLRRVDVATRCLVSKSKHDLRPLSEAIRAKMKAVSLESFVERCEGDYLGEPIFSYVQKLNLRDDESAVEGNNVP